MVSTRNSAGWPAASIAARIAGSGRVRPVAVSLCTTQTARDGVRRVLLQRGGDLGDIDAAAPVGMHRARLQAELGRHHAPFVGEVAGLQDQDRVAGRQHVGQRRLPGAVAGGGVHEQMLARSAARA